MSRRSFADRILDAALSGEATRAAIRDELERERDARSAREGRRAGDRWYLRQAVSVWAFATRDRWLGTPWTGQTPLLVGGRERLIQDLADGVRTLRRSPGYSVAVMLTLALAMTATSSVFAVVNGVLLKDLPYPDGDRIVRFDALRDGVPTQGGLDYPTIQDWRERFATVTSISAYQASEGVYVGDGIAEVWTGQATDRDYLRVTGIEPFLGRWYAGTESGLGAQTIVLSHEIWERRFGSDPGIVGRTIDFAESTWTVQAVMPSGFTILGEPFDYWMPIRRTQWSESRGTGVFQVVGRLEEGVSLEAARDELAAISANLEEVYPGEIRDVVLRRAVDVEREPVRAVLWVLFGAVGFLLLVACANVAGLALARTESRREELAVRRSLGATGRRVASQIVVESVILSMLGGGLGLVGAEVGVRGLLALAPPDLPQRAAIQTDPTVGFFALIVAITCGVAFGAVPGMRATRRGGLRPSAARSTSRASRRTHAALASIQVGLAAVLLSGSALLLRSFSEMSAVETGFVEPERILMVEMGLGRDRYGSAQEVLTFQQELMESVHALAMVESVGLSTHLPFTGSRLQAAVVREGEPYERGKGPQMGIETINGAYRDALGLELSMGRDPTVAPSGVEASREVLVNETGAALLWPGENPLGRRFSFDLDEGQVPADSTLYTVVGVVPDVSDGGLDHDVRPRAYYDLRDFRRQYSFITGRFFYLTVRTAGDPRAAVDPIRSIVRRLDPNAPLRSVSSLEALVRDTTLPIRFRTVALTLFAVLAGLVAMLGVYGVMAYGVQTSMRDFGVRLALGAPASGVRAAVLNRALVVVSIGLVGGLVGSLALGPLLESLLFGVSAWDPPTLLTVLLLSGLGGLAAAWIPAARASRADPVRILKAE